MIGPEALPGEREHSVTLDLDMAISDKIITEKKSAQSWAPPHWHILGKTLWRQMHCIKRWGLTVNVHALLLKALHSHCSCLDFSADLWQSGKQTAGLLDKQRDRSCFWIRLTWILWWTHTPTESVYQIQICESSALPVTPLIWRPICCTVHLSTEPFSQSKSTDNLTNLNITLSDRNFHSASLNYSTVCCMYCPVGCHRWG